MPRYRQSDLGGGKKSPDRWGMTLSTFTCTMSVSYLDGTSSGDTMGDTEGGVVMDSFDSVRFIISDSFIKEFTTVSL